MSLLRLSAALFFIAIFFQPGACLRAGDSELLNSLLEKDILDKSELQYIKKNSSQLEIAAPKSPYGFKLYTILQMRYGYLYRDSQFPHETSVNKSDFNIRRLIPVFIAETGENSRAMVSLFMPSSRVLNTAHYEIDFDGSVFCGKLMIGHNAVNFATEELESGSTIMTPDRSMLCLYFGGADSGYDGYNKSSYGTCEGFSGYHTGIFWNGRMPSKKELCYGIALTNSKADDYVGRIDNGLTFWLTLAYEKNFSDDFYLWTGVNLGYSDKLISAISGDTLPSSIEDCGDAWGANPFIRLKYKKFTFNAELIYTALEYGSSMRDDIPIYNMNSPRACPWGFYVLGAYKLFDLGEWGILEPLFRYARINTDGRGIREGDIIYKGYSGGPLFDEVESFYFGVNWYLRGNTVKYMFGYELYDFKGSPSGKRQSMSSVGVFIAQFQILF